jgi:hypothetical protein
MADDGRCAEEVSRKTEMFLAKDTGSRYNKIDTKNRYNTKDSQY